MQDEFDVAVYEALRLGLHPISGGSDDDTPDDTTTGGAGDDDTVAGHADDTVAGGGADDQPDEVARLREENARLTGELTGLRSQLPKPAASPATRQPIEKMTLAEVDQHAEELSADELATAISSIATQVDDGKVAAGYGARLLGRLEAVRLDRQRSARETAERPLRNAGDKLAAYIKKHPDLKTPGSDLLTKVTAELDGVVEEFGFPADDPRAQVIAVERVVGGHKLGGGDVDRREFERRKRQVGGVGSGHAGDGSAGKPDPVKEVERLYPDQVQYWDRIGYSADERRAEAPLVLQRRGARRRTA